MKRSRQPIRGRASGGWKPAHSPFSKRLIVATDHGHPVTVAPEGFAPVQRTGGWGSFAESFIRVNETAFRLLDVRPELTGGSEGVAIRLFPGECAGAVPLMSSFDGQVGGGLLVTPRFGWGGVGHLLQETGWQAAPELPAMHMVPGSARHVPPWVLAGPVLARLEALLAALRPGFRQTEEVLTRPRGHIVWSRYLSESLSRGEWHHLPCRYPELCADPLLRRHVRWALERIRRDLLALASGDVVALTLAASALHMLQLLTDVVPLMPAREEMERYARVSSLTGECLRRGLEAIAWIVDERGLGGGSERDGLAWIMPLSRLWETYVESVYRHEVAQTGGVMKVGRLRETVVPLEWSDPTHRTLGHLMPDIVIRRGSAVQVVDAKYKAHLVEVSETDWRRLEGERREAHRADLHQILAYASLYEADEITATLVYPLRYSTFVSLRDQRRDRSYAELAHGGRTVHLELRGLPFGKTQASTG